METINTNGRASCVQPLQIFLWGMETHNNATIQPHNGRLQIFLWGMETREKGRWRVCYCRYKSSYEEWKRSCTDYIAVLLYCYKSSYEEWKRESAVDAAPAIFGYKSSYEEWKLRRAPAAVHLQNGYKSSYEEWKQVSFYLHTQRGFLLQIFLWGMETG